MKYTSRVVSSHTLAVGYRMAVDEHGRPTELIIEVLQQPDDGDHCDRPLRETVVST